LPGIGDSTQPIVLPVANRNWQSEPDALDGRWNLNANTLDIVRREGTQTRRLSLGSEWDRTFRDGIGGQYNFSASLRGDGYSVSNLSPLSNPDLPSAFFPVNGQPAAAPTPTNFVTGRAFPQVGLVWSYPLIHRGEEMTELIEPIVGGFAGPSSGNRRNIPNEDSLSFEYSDSDLFRRDRLAGYDILDTGQRVDYGAKLGLYDKEGGSYRLLIGQSYRAQPNLFLPLGSGAENRLSDVVGRVVLSPNSYLDLIYRFRFDTSPFVNSLEQHGGRQRRRGAAGVERQPQCFVVGDLPGRMHGLYRLGEPIGDPQRRRHPRGGGAIQRRVQEPRRDRRQRRRDQRDSASVKSYAEYRTALPSCQPVQATFLPQWCRLVPIYRSAGVVSMTIIRWLGVLLIGLTGSSNAAMPTPAHRAPAQPPAAESPGDQGVETRIAAVVNDEVISVADLRSRLRMVMLSSNFPDSPETRQRIAGQVLRTIVDEKLQMQEARRQNVTATDEEIKKAISQIEKQNNMQPGQ